MFVFVVQVYWKEENYSKRRDIFNSLVFIVLQSFNIIIIKVIGFGRVLVFKG